MRYLLLFFIILLSQDSSGQALTFYCNQEYSACSEVFAQANSANVVINGNTAEKINDDDNWNSGFLQLNPLNPGDSFTWQIGNVRQVVGLSYNPSSATNWQNVDFAWYTYSNTNARVYDTVWGPILTGQNWTSGQQLRLTINSAGFVEYQYENGGAFVNFYTSSSAVTGPLFVFGTFGNSGARVEGLSVCTGSQPASFAKVVTDQENDLEAFYQFHSETKGKLSLRFFFLDLDPNVLALLPENELLIAAKFLKIDSDLTSVIVAEIRSLFL